LSVFNDDHSAASGGLSDLSWRGVRTDLAAASDLAASLPLWQRIRSVVRQGPLKLHEIAERVDAKVDTIERTIRRRPKIFTKLSDTSDRVPRSGRLLLCHMLLHCRFERRLHLRLR
jgi:hypothetical protein